MYTSPTTLAEDVRDGRGQVVVERGERAGGEPGVELCHRGEHHQREHVFGSVPRCLRAEPGEDRGDGPRHGNADDERRGGEHAERHRPGRDLLSEAPIDACPRERRQDDEPDRRRCEGKHDEDAVCREETVGLGRPAELAGDDHADDGREPRLHGDRQRGHRARRERPETR